jgi:hypothetical protein
MVVDKGDIGNKEGNPGDCAPISGDRIPAGAAGTRELGEL